EEKVITRPELTSTKAIHTIRARQLRYSSLLEDLKNTIMFIEGKPNPALESASEVERRSSTALVVQECDVLLYQVSKLQQECDIQIKRLKNLMNLVNVP
ncbi:hypothetical protein H0H93_004714, partial [Arthromyces matolae]